MRTASTNENHLHSAIVARSGSMAMALDRLRPEFLFIISAVFHYLGPAFAVLLFARVEPLGTAFLRILFAGLIYAGWRRPWRRWAAAPRSERTTIVLWAAILALMNSCFYLAIDRMPLGTVAAIEFAGPVALAVIAVRSRRNVLALGLAVSGVVALANVTVAGGSAGLTFALLNMLLFTGYIIFAHRVSRHTTLSGIDGLAAAMGIATVVALPLGLYQALPAFLDPVSLGASLGVAVTSSVIPYIFDQLAMQRISRAAYALLATLLPATATVIGVIVLTQIPSLLDIAGIALIVIGVAIHRERTDEHPGVSTNVEARPPG